MRTATCRDCGNQFDVQTLHGPLNQRCPACHSRVMTARSKRYRSNRPDQIDRVPEGYLTRRDLEVRWNLSYAGVQARLYEHDCPRHYFMLDTHCGRKRRVMAIRTTDADRIARAVETNVATRSDNGARARWYETAKAKTPARLRHLTRKAGRETRVDDSSSETQKPQKRQIPPPSEKTVSVLAMRFAAYRDSLLAAIPQDSRPAKVDRREYARVPPPEDLRVEWERDCYEKRVGLDVGEWE